MINLYALVVILQPNPEDIVNGIVSITDLLMINNNREENRENRMV